MIIKRKASINLCEKSDLIFLNELLRFDPYNELKLFLLRRKDFVYLNTLSTPIASLFGLIGESIADKSIYFMRGCTETSKLNSLAIFNLLGITISPIDRNITIRIRINKYVESTFTLKFRQKCH